MKNYTKEELINYLDGEIDILGKRLGFFEEFDKKEAKEYKIVISKLLAIKELIK